VESSASDKSPANAPGQIAPVTRGLIAAACVVIVVGGAKAASEVVGPLFLAFTLAVLFAPILQWLVARGLPGWLALLTMIASVLIGAFVLWSIISVSLSQLADRLPEYQALLAERMAGLISFLQSLGVGTGAIASSDWASGGKLIQFVFDFLGGLVSSTASIFFFLFLLILMLVESRNLPAKFHDVSGRSALFLRQFQRFAGEIQTQYRIQAFSNLLSATVLTVLFLLFRIDFALLWGTLAFFLGFIPNIGLIIATLPAFIIAFILHGPATAIVLIVLAIILNAAMDNLVTPRFFGEGLKIPFVVVFASFLLWGWVFGLIGALLAIPITLLLRLLLESSEDTRFAARFLQSEVDKTPPPPIPAEPAGVAGAPPASG
jgi:predicted PurR-regulated permease PerM